MSTLALIQERMGFVEELCVTLKHEWRPNELFMIFTGYFDETNTHGRAPTVILSAYMGHAAQWKRFERRLVKLQKKYEFRVFHAKDFKARANEFYRWPIGKCESLVIDLANAVSKLAHGVSISLSRERYETEYRSSPIPKKMHLDSQYGVCFRACLGRLLEVLEYGVNGDRLNIVLESGHPNTKDCVRIFEDIKGRWQYQGRRDVLGTCTIAWKSDCMPLMVADFLASAHGRIRSDEESKVRESGSLLVADKKPIPKGWISILELPPTALSDLKANWERDRLLGIEQRRIERARTKASIGRP